MKKIKKKPLVSFCISTYKRLDLLDRMIQKLLKQEYKKFEVIICDNDPKGSSKEIIEKYKSSKIKYYINSKNLGMIKSFNKAFRLSKGDFVVYVSDDDPPYPYMLKNLVDLYNKHPDCDSYFGAYDLFTPDKVLAQRIKMPIGYLSCRNLDWPKGAVKIFASKEYLKKALDGDIFYYLMWSTGMVKRSVVKKVGALSSYGSALMTDRSYCLKVGAFGKTLIYNKELASQLVHSQSFSLTSADAEILTKGFVGYYLDIQKYLRKYDLVKENEEFIIRHLINMFLIIKVGDEVRKEKTNVKFLMGVFDEISKKLPFILNYRFILKVMLIQRFPFETIFKISQIPPRKIVITIVRFIRYRLFNQLVLASKRKRKK